MAVEYMYTKGGVMNPLIYDIINNSVSMNRSGNDSLLSQEMWTRPWYIYALFVTLIILSLSLNAVVIVVCIRANLRKHPTNLYFLNLAIGDGATALLTMPYLHTQELPWTDVTCKLFSYFQLFIAIFTMNTLLLIAVERFVAVRLPLKFRSFTTQRCIIHQLCGVWVGSAVMVLYPTFHTPPEVKIGAGCFGRDGGFHLTVLIGLPTAVIVMATIYISILFKLRERQRREQSTKINSGENATEMIINPKDSCNVPLVTDSDGNVIDACVPVSNSMDTTNNFKSGLDVSISDRETLDTSDTHNVFIEVIQPNELSRPRVVSQCSTKCNNQCDDEPVSKHTPPIQNLEVKTNIQDIDNHLIERTTLSVEHSSAESNLPRVGVRGSREDCHITPEQQKTTTIDQRNKKAILLVLTIFLIMIACHAGLIFTIMYASINKLGQEHVYHIGDVIVLPYVVHTCFTPVLQLKYNDVVREGLPLRFR